MAQQPFHRPKVATDVKHFTESLDSAVSAVEPTRAGDRCEAGIRGEAILDLWREQIEKRAGPDLEKLFDSIKDQQAFAKLTRRIVSDLGLGDELGDDPDEGKDED